MIIDLNKLPVKTMVNFNGGEKELSAHMFIDEAGNKATKSMLLVVRVSRTPSVIDGEANLYGNLTLTDKPFYNVNENTTPVVINGNGYTVTEVITSADKFNWTENGNVVYVANGRLTTKEEGNAIFQERKERYVVDKITARYEMMKEEGMEEDYFAVNEEFDLDVANFLLVLATIFSIISGQSLNVLPAPEIA